MEATATHPQVIQSPNDRRKYKSLYLKNKVKILLISDPGKLIENIFKMLLKCI
jgi:hypothetical protein